MKTSMGNRETGNAGNREMARQGNRKKRKQGNARNLWLAGAAAGLIVLAGAAGTFVYKFNTSDATIAEGNKAFTAQEYDAALAKYQTAQQSAPIFAEPFYNAANVLYKQSQFDQAAPMLQEALAREPEAEIVEPLSGGHRQV